MLIDGKVAIVLGGEGGIGKASCKALLSKGAKVCSADLPEHSSLFDKSKKEFDNKSFLYLRCDATKDREIEKVFETATKHFGKRPEIVMTTVAVVDEFNWQKCVDINICASIRLVNAALDWMGINKVGNGGSVILTSSVSGLQPEPWGPVYCATKHAIIGLARSWAAEQNYLQHGIRFNCLCPCMVDTPFLKQITNAYYSDQHQKRIDTNPRIAPETVAETIIRVTEDDSLNGETIFISTKDPFQLHTFTPLDPSIHPPISS